MRHVFYSSVVAVMLCIVSCGTYTVVQEVENNDGVEGITKAGIVMRVPRNIRIAREEYINNIRQWLTGVKALKELYVFQEGSEELVYTKGDEDRFYQFSERSRFLKYKSLGIINLYLRNNSAELKKMISDKNLNGVIFYEVFGVTSTEMQFVDFDSVVTIVDKNLNVVYLDHQSNNFSTSEFDFDKVKHKLFDLVSQRLVEKLDDLEFLEND